MRTVGTSRAQVRGQVLVIAAILLTILLAAAGFAIDIGRQEAERRHVQNAADAAALAGCRALIEGGEGDAVRAAAEHVALLNLQGSPAAAEATIANPPSYVDLNGDGTVGAGELTSGILVSGSSVRVAIASSVDTVLARVVGVDTLNTGGRALCQLQGGPALPIVARRYTNPPGPDGGFADHVATSGSSMSGAVDPLDPRGYNGVRTPASVANPGPEFVLYGTDSKAVNDASFRGFVALDIRNFESDFSRRYYNGVTSGTNPNTLKDMQSAYISTGYPGPPFPAVASPPNGSTQVAVMSGLSNSFVVGEFSKHYQVGDRVLLAVYDGTVMEIPDFSIQPPANPPTIASTTTAPTDLGSIVVRRNDAFSSTVTLRMVGDTGSGAGPDEDIVAEPEASPLPEGTMSQPTWSTNVFVPAKQGTTVQMEAVSTNAITPGIYTVWVEGQSGNPYFRTRRQAVAIRVDGSGTGANGPARRDFTLTLGSGDTNTTVNGTISLPVWLKTSPSGQATAWGATGSTVALSWDTDSFTDCSLQPQSLGLGTSIGFSPASVTPTSSGSGTQSTMTINTTGLAQGCYQFVIRATGTNGDNQRVTHLESVRFTVGGSGGSQQYVDIIGFAVFEVTDVTANSISARAISPIRADPNDYDLRRAQRARLVPWS